MRKKIKCLLSIILSMLFIFSLTITVGAIEPRYSDTDSITIALGFIGTTANCSVIINGADGTTSIDSVNITLKDSNGNTKKEWKNLSSNSKNFNFYETVSDLTKGETYTLELSANINRKNNTESIKKSRTQTCPSK